MFFGRHMHQNCLLSICTSTPACLLVGNDWEKKLQMKKTGFFRLCQVLCENERQQWRFYPNRVTGQARDGTDRQGTGISYWAIPALRSMVILLRLLSLWNGKDFMTQAWHGSSCIIGNGLWLKHLIQFWSQLYFIDNLKIYIYLHSK